MRGIISLICILLPAVTFGETLEIRDNAPDRHIVVKGDTLWDISAVFFKDPWKWQKIWNLNKESVKNPHWIYPGDIIFLDRDTGTLRVSESNAPTALDYGKVAESSATNNIVKLSPVVREVAGESVAIPSIPFDAIAPFLAKPIIVDDTILSGEPTIVGALEHRSMLGFNDVAYVRNMPVNKGTEWQVYRLGQTFLDPDSGETLGHEINYLGEATVEKFADISLLRITKAVSEIALGDYLSQSKQVFSSSIIPNAPSFQIEAKIISVYGGVSQAGQNAIVSLNKGRRDGLEEGHVLALYQKGEVVKDDSRTKTSFVVLPNLRYGLVLVFRVFQKVSYALVLQSRIPAQILDIAQTP